MVHFVGAGPGAPDLMTLRGAELVKQADIIIYAGSLVNPEILALARPDCRVYNSAEMTLEQVLAVMEGASNADIVRLHTGDPCLYGAIREQMESLGRHAWGIQLLRCGGGVGGGVHAARREPERDYHPHGGTHAGAGAGEFGADGAARRVHGGVSVRRTAGGGTGVASAGSVYGGHPGGDRLQGHVAGGADHPLHGGDSGGGRRGGGHPEDGHDFSGRIPLRQL